MKKGLVQFGFCLVILISVIAFFGGNAWSKEALPQSIYIATGPPGGYQYLTITYLGNLTKSKYGMGMTPVGGGSDLNIAKIIKGEVLIGNVVSEPGYLAYRGKSTAATREEAQNNLRLIASTDEAPFLFAVKKDSGINSPTDLKGKGLMARYTTFLYSADVIKYVLEGYGVDPGSVRMVKGTTGTDGYTSFKDRLIDSFFAPMPTPHHFWEELCKDYNAKVIGVEKKEARARVIDNMPAVTEATVPKGTYPGQTEDIHTIAVTNNWLGNKKTPDRVVEIFLDELYNPKNREQLIKLHTILKQYSLERAVKNPQLPFHEAAVKYYKKVGVWTPELEKKQQSLLKLGGQVK